MQAALNALAEQPASPFWFDLQKQKPVIPVPEVLKTSARGDQASLTHFNPAKGYDVSRLVQSYSFA